MYSVPQYASNVQRCEDTDIDLHSLGAWEREERARNAIESGYAGLGSTSGRSAFLREAGEGPYSKRMAAIWGANESAFEASVREAYAESEGSPRVFRLRPAPLDNRTSLYLSGRQFVELYSAVSYANSLGLVMNVHVSITWGLLGIHSHEEAAKALRYEFFKHLQEWYEYRMPDGRPFVWLYVHEVGRKHGFHTHLLTAIPDELRQEFRDWMASRMSKLSRTGAVPKGTYKIVAPPSDKIVRQWWYFRYFCKGIGGSEEVASSIGTEPGIKAASLIGVPGGRPADVRCRKRCGVSNNIGAQARKNARHESLLERGVTDVRRLYAGMEYLSYLRSHPNTEEHGVMRRLLENEALVQEVNATDAANAAVDAEWRKLRKAVLDRQRKVARRLDRQHEERLARLMALFRC